MLFRARLGTMKRSAAGPRPQRVASFDASGKFGSPGPGVSAAPGDRARSGCDGSGNVTNPLAGHLAVILCGVALTLSALAADNELTEAERKQGWLLLFDGKTTSGWMTSAGQPSKTPVEQGSLNPHHSGHYMLVHTQQWSNFLLSLDFKISQGCNSGIFVHTASLTPRPGKDVGFNGIEIAIDDTPGAGYHDTGAIYDLVKPTKQAMKQVGQWNHIEIACITNRIEVVLNGEPVTRADLNLFVEPNKRPDGTTHKFDIAYKNHPQRGYLGLQDHGSPCWFKNIKLRPIPDP